MELTIFTYLFAINMIVLTILISYGFTQTRKEVNALHREVARQFVVISDMTEEIYESLISIDDDDDDNDKDDDTDPPIDRFKLTLGGLA
jgi:hypothetical protein